MESLTLLTRGRLGRLWGRTLRNAAGLSLQELAEEIGVDPATLARWEVGKTKPRRAAALRWAVVLDHLAHTLGELGAPSGSTVGPSGGE